MWQPRTFTHHAPPLLCCLNTCRGKFDCGFFSDSLQLTNKQTSAEVPYSSIQHVLVRQLTAMHQSMPGAFAPSFVASLAPECAGHRQLHIKKQAFGQAANHNSSSSTSACVCCLAALPTTCLHPPQIIDAVPKQPNTTFIVLVMER